MFYGIDLAKESFKAAILAEGSSDVRMISSPLQGDAFDRFKNKLTDTDYVAIEASTNTFWFVDQIRGRVKDCFVLDPYALSNIYNAQKKTDVVDAIKIAHRLKCHILYDDSSLHFPSIFIPDHTIRELRSLLTTYDTLKCELVMAKNRIRSILTQNGFTGLKSKDLCRLKHQETIMALPLQDGTLAQLRILFNLLRCLESGIEQTRNEVLRQGSAFAHEVDLLTSIRGISPFVAVMIMADIADIRRFPNAKHFCSYLRAAPKIDASGKSTRIGKVNKHSRPGTMSLLVECINHFRDGSKGINAFFERKVKGKSRGKVRVAVVRKILVAIYHMLTNNEYYRDMDYENHDRKMREFNKIIKKAA